MLFLTEGYQVSFKMNNDLELSYIDITREPSHNLLCTFDNQTAKYRLTTIYASMSSKLEVIFTTRLPVCIIGQATNKI